MVTASSLIVTEHPLPPLHDLAQRWRELEARAEASFFQSWVWIGSWLAALEGHPPAALRLIAVHRDARLVGLAVIGLTPRRIFLHQSGAPANSAIEYVEYNDILAEPAAADDIRAACLDFIRIRWPWRQLRIQAASAAMHRVLADSRSVSRTYRAEACAYTDFATLSPDAETLPQFLGLLSSNTRQQINRAQRRARSVGAVTLTRADTTEAAASYLSELMALHGAAWRERDQDGAFASPQARRFAAHLVQEGLACGTVELLRLQAGAQTLGVLLNFVFRGHAYSYQSGFAYTADNRDKPGLLCHALAAADYIRRGVRAYHFMAGPSRYKDSLSNATEQLRWVETYPNAVVARVEDTARSLWRALRGGPQPVLHDAPKADIQRP